MALWAYRSGTSIAACVARSDWGWPRLGSTFKLTLRPPRSKVVRVLDPSGRPVEGARVRPVSHDVVYGAPQEADVPGACVMPIPREIVERLAVRTDAHGLAELVCESPDDIYEVRIETPQFGDQWVELKLPENGASPASLAPVGRLSGRVNGHVAGRARDIQIHVSTSLNGCCMHQLRAGGPCPADD